MKPKAVDHRTPKVLLAALLAGVLFVASAPTAGAVAGTERISVASNGRRGNSHSFQPSISADGRYVAFWSFAENLAPGGDHIGPAVFVHDRFRGTTERVSVTWQGRDANGLAMNPSISDDGRYVAFESDATNLVRQADDNGHQDVFVRDLRDKTTELVSVAADGGGADGGASLPSISPDGGYVAFVSDATNLVANAQDRNGHNDVFVRDRTTGTTQRVSVDTRGGDSDGTSHYPSISSQGRFVAFESSATDLLRAGDRNNTSDVFVRNRAAGTTERVSLDSQGREAAAASMNASISDDGRYVAFQSLAGLIPQDGNRGDDVYVRDRVRGTLERVSVSRNGGDPDLMSGWPAISPDGGYVAFVSMATNLMPGRVPGVRNVFVRDRANRRTELVAPGDTWLPPSVSSNGRYVAFWTFAPNLVPDDPGETPDVFVRDRAQQRTELVSVATGRAEGNSQSLWPAVSGDGRWVAFESAAYNLAPGDGNRIQDVFLRDRRGGTTERVSLTSAGGDPNGQSFAPSVSGDGRVVVFESDATNLPAGAQDRNGVRDIYVRDRTAEVTQRVSVGINGDEPNGPSFSPSVSANGRYVAFESWATNLVEDDDMGVSDVFVRDLATGVTERVSVTGAGGEANDPSFAPAISPNGQVVAFASLATNLTAAPDGNGSADVYVRDRSAGTTEWVSAAPGGQPNGASFFPSVSENGRYVAFESDATNLAADPDGNGVRDIYVRDRGAALTQRVSVDAAGGDANGPSYAAAVNGNGRYVAFESDATDLAADQGGHTDIYVRDRTAAQTSLVSLNSDGGQATGRSRYPSISADGRYVAFASWAANLVPEDRNQTADIFVRARS